MVDLNRCSSESCGLEPDNRSFRNTLGVAQYRVGLHEEALATLCRSGDMAICISECEEAYDMGIIAMALHKVGQLERARTAYQKLLELVAAREDSDPQLTSFQREDFESRVRMKEGSIVKETWFKMNKALGDFQDYSILEGGHYQV